MSEQRLKDFAEAAEQRVPVPDLVDLTSRGQDLRRIRMAAAAGALALVTVAGGVLASVTHDDRSEAPVVDRAPLPSMRAQEPGPRSLGDAALVVDREYVVHPWQMASPDDVEARFRVPGRHWVWREDGAVRPQTPGHVFPSPPEPYARVGVSAPDSVPASGCELEVARWTPLADTPIAAARQIAQVPDVVLEQRARPTRVLGHQAAHVRLSVPRLCPVHDDVAVWGQSSTSFTDMVSFAGQVLDVWVVDVDGLLVVVHTEVSPGLPESIVDETRALFGSLTLDRVRR